MFSYAQNNTNTKGLLKVDHSQMAEMQSGIYRMKLEGDTARVDLLSNDKSLSVTLPAVPGPKGGVLVLSDRLDASKIATNKCNSTPLADRSKIFSTSGNDGFCVEVPMLRVVDLLVSMVSNALPAFVGFFLARTNLGAATLVGILVYF